ncbi:DUF1064 domain-containing protein [Cytobacillus horneckiae]|uniref:DUF1064 domain-containing protein n=1 Tax=Cytobacillus horneckiae TaxID=549687 RepID=A0A2N0ZH02_9BACI|nr:DUF1064 domain-containing protein [Cytobacillus horneckiae]
MAAVRKRSKYGNKKVVVDGHTFDSKAEAKYYQQLKWLQQANQIESFKLQPRYLLQEGFKKNGKTYRAIHYKADFEVHKLDGTVEIIDIKGAITKEFSIKRKLFEMKYMDSIKLLKYDQYRGFIEVS